MPFLGWPGCPALDGLWPICSDIFPRTELPLFKRSIIVDDPLLNLVSRTVNHLFSYHKQLFCTA